MREHGPMEASEMHRRAQQVFTEVLAQVRDSDLSEPTPCAEWTVDDLIAHVIDGNRHVAEMLGDADPTPVEGGLLATHVAASSAASTAFDDPALGTRTVELPFGEIPAVVFAHIRAGDLYVHAWDLAVAIGADNDLDRELGDAIYAATAPVLTPELRGEGRPFGAEEPCAGDRPIADRMAAFLGRQVPTDRPN